MDPIYGYAAVNVEAQSRSLSSLLNWTKRLIGVRKSTQVFGRGTLTFVRPANRAVLAYVRALGEDAILCVANMSRAAQAVELDISAWKGRIPQEMLGRTRFPRIGDLPYLVTLPPYGFFWFHLLKEVEKLPEKVLPPDITTLVLGPGWESLLTGWTRRTLEGDVLPSHMPDRRWFSDKAFLPVATHVSATIPIEHGNDRFLALVADISGAHGMSRYFLPVTIRWIRYTAVERPAANILAAVRRGAREGTLLDATPEPEFAAALLSKIKAGEVCGGGAQRIEFHPTSAFNAEPPSQPTCKAISAEQSNSSVVVDNTYVLKVIRRISAGVHPDAEIGRFLIEQTGFRNVPALLGTAELVEGDNRSVLMVVHEFIQNQGDAWTITGAALDRLIDEVHMTPTQPEAESAETSSLVQRMRQIGRRTAEMHLAFGSRDDIPAFAPEPITSADTAAWAKAQSERAGSTIEVLENSQTRLDETTLALAQKLFAARNALLERIATPIDVNGRKIRHHGDFHLGQVLIAKDDAYFLDFEGEPLRSLEERRRKGPAARDVAGFLRSIDYAVSAALERATDLKPEERASLTPQIRQWSDKLCAAYWDSYREVIGISPLWPAAAQDRQRLLNVFLLEKALYEIEYELANRPAWLHIPLEATLRILQQQGVTP
jgi:maltose alpha-D-glucosyltransferase/alpha-amylase